MDNDDLDVIKKYYEEISKIYDDAIYTNIPEEMVEEQAVLKNIVDFIELRDPILDLGCGTGHWTKIFSKRGYSVVGIDISPEMLEIAKKEGLENLILSDIRQVPFKDNSFGTVTSFWTLQHMLTLNDLKSALNEMYRLVKKDGTIIIGDNVYNIDGVVLNEKHLDVDEWVGEWGLKPLQVYRRITNPQEIANISKENGFRVVEQKEKNNAFYQVIKRI